MLQDLKSIYKQRLMTADEAVSKIKTGDRVAVSHAAGEPTHLIDAMVRGRQAFSDVEIIHMVPMGTCEYAQEGMEQHFRHNSLFVGAKTRNTVERGHGDFTPCFFSRIPKLFDSAVPLDVALINVSPPDEHGYVSCGVAVDYSKTAAEKAKIVIAQINKYMPRTLGDTFLNISQLDCIVEFDEPLIELQPPIITDVEKAIGENCAKLINDGDCLQLGIGAIPDAVLLFLKDKKNLGIHSEMFSDGVIELLEAGVINNSAKNFHHGKCIATFLMGTRRLYDYVDNNPAVNMFSSSYVNDPMIASQNDNLVSINSCVQVDFLGQVCAESIGTKQISAIGGQADFVRAAAFSRGGRSIIAMPSTTSNGKISKIVPFLDLGAVVTTSRYDVQYIVTEYGVADLRYKTTRDRARALTRIAHPKFREELKEAFRSRFNAEF